ncbi:MAG TPA: hypothetical protein VF213_08420 [Dongiaceae bacterium]
MPYVRGFLKVGRRQRPGRPDIGLPEEENGGTDPDYGIEEGGGIDNELPELPSPPPGIWPPLTPENPWRPVDPGYGIPGGRPPHVGGGPARPPGAGGRPDQGLPGEGTEVEPPMVLPPGAIWPPLPPDVHGKFLALVLVGGMGHGVKYRYVVIDADAKPPHRPGRPEHPIAPGGPDSPQPKR